MKEITKEYKQWITEIKDKIHSVQIKSAIAVNSVLIEFYWELGKMISEKENIWGSKLIEQTAKDLKDEFPDMKGLSFRNLKYCRQFYQFYDSQIGQQAVAQLQNTESKNSSKLVSQIPWGHNILIFTKAKDTKEAYFFYS